MNVNLPSKTPIVGDDAQIDWTRIDTGLEFNGKKIVLPGEPGEMPYQVAIDTIERIAEAEAQVYAVTEHVDGLPWDSAVALYRAMQQIYGVVLPQSIPTWFGPKPPTFLTIRVGVGDTDLIQVPMGSMSLPGIKKPVRVGINYAGAFIAGLVDAVFTTYLGEVEDIEREIEKLDQIALRQSASHDDFLDHVVQLRRRIALLRRWVAPNRDAIAPLIRPDFELHGDIVTSWPGMLDRLEHVIGAVENARELLVGSLDIYLGRSAQRSNDVMKTLTIVSSIALPAVVLAGVMGMNFQIAFFDNASNFYVVVVAMLVISIVILLLARWRRWI